VAHTVLGGGYSSRLNQVIRIERGLSYGAFGGAELHPLGGVWTGQAQTRHTSAAEVAQIMRQQILRLATEPVPEKELDARKAVLIGSLAGRLQTTGGLAGLLVSQVAQGRDPAELQQRVAQIQAVTSAQVQAHAARYWKPESLRVVVAGDWQAAGEAGRAIGEPPGANDTRDAVRRWPKDRLDFDHPALGARADGS
jgi:zinc protease